MSKFANALGKNFSDKKNELRIRTFDIGSHTFKVKVPLTVEYDTMQKRMNDIDKDLVHKYYDEMAKSYLEKKEENKDNADIVYKEDDIEIEGRSLKESANNKVILEKRITEMFKLIVPEDGEFDMDTITYADIDEFMPFPVQMEMIEAISNAVSPSYKGNRGKS
jgi:hypothetical protein